MQPPPAHPSPCWLCLAVTRRGRARTRGHGHTTCGCSLSKRPPPQPLHRCPRRAEPAAAPDAFAGGSKQQLPPGRPGFSFKRILSLINSFEAFRTRYLIASSAPSPVPSV